MSCLIIQYMNLESKILGQRFDKVSKDEFCINRSEKDINYNKVIIFIKQLLIDIPSREERFKADVIIEEIKLKSVKSFCKNNNGLNAYEKMSFFELKHEPIEKIISISRKDCEELTETDIKKILEDLGYNINVLLSKKDSCDFDAAVNINGYSIPGWKKFIVFLRKLNTNIAVFLGKRFAPGRSRLHLRFYKGNKNWYAIAHIDFNWMSLDLRKINKAHNKSGQGDYKTGNRCFAECLKKYFEKN